VGKEECQGGCRVSPPVGPRAWWAQCPEVGPLGLAGWFSFFYIQNNYLFLFPGCFKAISKIVLGTKKIENIVLVWG
jgi:hypothetical protein